MASSASPAPVALDCGVTFVEAPDIRAVKTLKALASKKTGLRGCGLIVTFVNMDDGRSTTYCSSQKLRDALEFADGGMRFAEALPRVLDLQNDINSLRAQASE